MPFKIRQINKLFLAIMFFILLKTNSYAQRDFGVCDSTSYILNSDTTIVVGRNKVYLRFNNTQTLLYNFSSANADEYIRDFDIVKPDLWYSLVGLRYIGGNTRLYKSIDKGNSWLLDTNHFNASKAESVSPQFLNSINNLQHLNGDTLLMFMHYYESGILYSTDLGKTWTKWFHNLIAHYQGMFECQNKYYIYGYAGDGFRASMFGFNKNLLFTSDSTGLWSSFNNLGYHPPCYNGDTINCIYATHNLTRCGVYHFFQNEINSICSSLNVDEEKTVFNIYPNPFTNKINIDGTNGEEYFTLNNLYGETIWRGIQIESQNFEHSPSGVYFLSIVNKNKSSILKLIKE